MCEECEQLRVQLAGCGVAALGATAEDQVAKRGDYGWSPAYQDVLDLRRRYDLVASKFADSEEHFGCSNLLGEF